MQNSSAVAVIKYEFQQIAPTPARGKFTPELYTDQGWWLEEKFDGDRRIAQFVGGRVRFTGRRQSDKDGLFVEKTDNVPHLNGQMHPYPVSLEGTVLDGEIICAFPGARSKDVTSIMGSAPEKALKKQQERGWVLYKVFDCLYYKGEDVRGLALAERRQLLESALAEWNNQYATAAQIITENREQFIVDVWARGGEGGILKDRLSTYDQEKRWVKIKKENTEDVVIMGFDPPEQFTEKTESYVENGIKKKRVLEVSESRLYKNGWIGAVRFGQYKGGVLTYCGSCSGMDDALRADLSKNKEKYVGQVVEILANEREADTGKFRHPRWVQLRNNKNPQDCKWPE